jgi:hypothetical protein
MSAAPLELPLSVVPGLRLLPAPCSEPPYDDERPGGRPLPLRSTSLVARPLRIVPAFLDDEEPVRTPASDLPPAQPFAHALVQRLLEVVAGVRPLKQLQRDTTLEVYDELERVLTSRPRVAGPRPDGRAVRSVRVQQRPGGDRRGLGNGSARRPLRRRRPPPRRGRRHLALHPARRRLSSAASLDEGASMPSGVGIGPPGGTARARPSRSGWRVCRARQRPETLQPDRHECAWLRMPAIPAQDKCRVPLGPEAAEQVGSDSSSPVADRGAGRIVARRECGAAELVGA